MNTSSETADVWVLYCRSLLTLFGADNLDGADGTTTAASALSRVSSSTSAMPVAQVGVSIAHRGEI